VARRNAVITHGDVGLRAATDDEAGTAHAAARTGRAVAAKLARNACPLRALMVDEPKVARTGGKPPARIDGGDGGITPR
jgi:hypothetical protein